MPLSVFSVDLGETKNLHRGSQRVHRANRFKNEEVISEINEVLKKIGEFISGNNPPLPRERGTEGVR